jgi:NodT family efflux transporter outer membrane factor (OMF) lipoprotein
MINMKIKYHYTAVALFALLSCHVTKPYQQPVALNRAGNLFRDPVVADSSSMARIPWQTYFNDTTLHALIAAGLENNLDLKIAMERMMIARAGLQKGKAAFLPAVGATASVRPAKVAYTQGFGFVTNATQYDLGLNASWEADIWGKLRSAKRVAVAGLLQSEAAKRAVQAQLVADIASNYYLLLALDDQLLILQKTAANRSNDVATMKELQASNVVNGAAVVQSQANYYGAEVAIPGLKKRIRETENVLSILLGRNPGSIPRSNLAGQQLPAGLNTGIPAQLLANRPDVAQAELAFRAAFENTNVARTYFYPALSLTAAGGFSSFDLNGFFTNINLFGNIAAGILQPVYNKGINKARLKTAEAQQQMALYNFQQSLLVAGREVSDALYAWQSVEDRKTNRQQQIQALETAVDFTKTLLRYSTSTNYTDVLTTEQNLLSAQLEQVNDQMEQWMAVISLYHALGGGWR